jgi:L-ornithine N5-monooxygenase
VSGGLDRPEHDILGIGFGPANIALAVALEETLPDARIKFLESRPSVEWQPGMMIDRSNIQNHPLRDLVTPRNPLSRYSFVNYLFVHDRLLEHLNLGVEFPLRKEYGQYIAWVGSFFSRWVDLDRQVTGVDFLRDGRGALTGYKVTTSQGVYTARALVVATGRTPFVPAPFDRVLGDQVFHFTEYLERIRRDKRAGAPVKKVAVIGGSQSAVELTLDLSQQFPDATIVNYVRCFAARLKDTSPFSEESIMPAFVDYYYSVSQESKDQLDADLRFTNYSSCDMDVIKELYHKIYEQRLDGEQKLFVKNNRQVTDVVLEGGRAELTVRERHKGFVEKDSFDRVVLATGFRNLGQRDNEEAFPPILKAIAPALAMNENHCLKVALDYALSPRERGSMPPLYLYNLCESSHGIADAGSFSLLALRAGTLASSLRRALFV